MSYNYNYDYTRDFVESYNNWDINNPQRVDELGNQIYLANEVEEALPGKAFIFYGGYNGNPALARFLFETELTTEEKSILDDTVYNHKNNL
jgi:hypothetical protein